jgi:hypothetical protein
MLLEVFSSGREDCKVNPNVSGTIAAERVASKIPESRDFQNLRCIVGYSSTPQASVRRSATLRKKWAIPIDSPCCCMIKFRRKTGGQVRPTSPTSMLRVALTASISSCSVQLKCPHQ